MAAKEALSPTFEEVAGQVAARTNDPAGPKPDQPYTLVSSAYGDPGHVNPAINPAPIWAPAERPPPVPVVNDPGLLGGNPDLAELNKAARASYGVPDTDSTSGITVESHQEEIKRVATERLQRLKGEQTDASGRARADARVSRDNKGDKFGSASSKG